MELTMKSKIALYNLTLAAYSIGHRKLYTCVIFQFCLIIRAYLYATIYYSLSTILLQ